MDLRKLKVHFNGYFKVMPHLCISTKSGRMVKALRFPVVVVCKALNKSNTISVVRSATE